MRQNESLQNVKKTSPTHHWGGGSDFKMFLIANARDLLYNVMLKVKNTSTIKFLLSV